MPRNVLYLICLVVVLTWLGGCARGPWPTAEAPQLTHAQQVRVGKTVASRLLQMLGGPYHDKTLVGDLNRLVKPHLQDATPFAIEVADRSAAAIYPLPGHRAVLTRGLLAGVTTRAELEALLRETVRLSGGASLARASHAMVEATGEVLAGEDSLYDPEAAGIRLARLFEGQACERECLARARDASFAGGVADSAGLPASITRLAMLQQGYELLGKARGKELAEDQGQAIALSLQAAAVAPDEPQILGALGLSYLRAGEVQQARMHLQKAVRLQPGYYRTLMGLGYLFLQEGQLGLANQSLAESVRLLAVPENLFLLAEAREKSADTEGAMMLYRLVAAADRNGKLGRTAASRLTRPGGAQ